MRNNKNIIFIIIIGIMSLSNSINAQMLDPELTNLIKQGINNNHQIKINDYKITQTQIDRHKAYKTFLPKLTLNASYTRLNDDITVNPIVDDMVKGTQKFLSDVIGIPITTPIPTHLLTKNFAPILDKNVIKSSADLEWIFFTGLEATYAVKATKHKEEALKYAGKITEKKMVKDIIKTYDQLALVFASDNVLQSAEKQLNAQEKRVKSAVKNGFAIKIDLKRIDLARQKLNIKKADVQRKKQLLRQKLSQLTGEEVSKLQILRPELKPLLIQSTLIEQQTKPTEIKSLEEVVQAKTYQQRMSYSKYIPKIAVKGHYEFLDDDLTLLDPKWYIGIGAKWEIFDGLKSYDNAQKIKLDTEIYQEKILEAKELLNLAQTNAKLNYELTQKQIQRHKVAVDLAKETYELINKQYQNGLVSITEVLDALTRWQKEEFNLKNAYFDQRQAAIELLYRKDLLNTLIQQ